MHFYSYRYMSHHEADAKFVMKAPFVTHGQHFQRTVSTLKAAMNHLGSVHKSLYCRDNPPCYVVPYIMIQEKVLKNNEIKAIFLGGVFSHFLCSVTQSTVVCSFPNFSKEQVVKFAHESLVSLMESSHFILDGLVRVDIFVNNVGSLVVNEVESLEARFFSAFHREELACEEFLKQYWERKIYEGMQALPIR